MRLWVAASSTHQPLESLLLPRWEEGDKLRLGAKAALSLLTFCYNSPCYRNPKGVRPAWLESPLCLGGWRSCCADLLAAVLRAWSCAGPCRAKARTAARSHFEGFWALGELPVRCRVPGLCAERAPARTLVSADLVTRPGSKNISGPLIEKWGLLRGRDFRMCVQFQRDPDSGVTIATSAHCIPGCWAAGGVTPQFPETRSGPQSLRSPPSPLLSLEFFSRPNYFQRGSRLPKIRRDTNRTSLSASTILSRTRTAWRIKGPDPRGLKQLLSQPSPPPPLCPLCFFSL